MPFQLKGDRKLFYTWLRLGMDFARLRYIFESRDAIIPDSELVRWKKEFAQLRDELENMYIETVGIITSNPIEAKDVDFTKLYNHKG